MKKLFITLLTLVAIVTAVDAQSMSKEQREKTMYNLIIRMRPVGTKYAITTTPVTYNEYWAATGTKAHSAGTSVTKAAAVTRAQAEKMVKNQCGDTRCPELLYCYSCSDFRRIKEGGFTWRGWTTEYPDSRFLLSTALQSVENV